MDWWIDRRRSLLELQSKKCFDKMSDWMLCWESQRWTFVNLTRSTGAANSTCHHIIISSHPCQDMICKQFDSYFMRFPPHFVGWRCSWCEKFFDLFETAHHPQSEEEEAAATKIWTTSLFSAGRVSDTAPGRPRSDTIQTWAIELPSAMISRYY